MAPRYLSFAAVAALLLAAAAPGHAASKPPFTIEDLGTGEGAPANCTFDDSNELGKSWVEMTQVSGPGGARPPACIQI